MPGYMLHLAACNEEVLKNRSFVVGVEAPDILKKHFKIYGDIDKARDKYNLSLKTEDMPDYSELEERVQQKEQKGMTEGLHYGVSSSPDIKLFWNSLSIKQRKMLFYKGYAWHLLTDAIMYDRLDIDSKFDKKLVRDTYKGIELPAEVEELGSVKFIDDGELEYVDWDTLKETIDYLRTFDPINGDMDSIIEAVLSNIKK